MSIQTLRPGDDFRRRADGLKGFLVQSNYTDYLNEDGVIAALAHVQQNAPHHLFRREGLAKNGLDAVPKALRDHHLAPEQPLEYRLLCFRYCKDLYKYLLGLESFLNGQVESARD